MNCELEPFGPCEGGLQRHHIIPRAALMKNKGAKRYVEQSHPEVLMADVCAKHHENAQTKYNKALLIWGKCVTYGAEYVGGVLEDLQAEFKGPRPELGLEAILHSGAVKR
ncbi:hypothetical protein LCGC14_0921950 [marine sediment metagenome]|uniref:Uncharacterized protein n=1 Tax=marine sediment metagenome TaxID=412755 RepID=A0A0F9NVD4_9ZZZZ